MLSSADRDLIQRDIALPGLGTLLDSEAFLAELSGVLPAVDGAQARIYYLRYKPGANCLAKFRLDLNGETIWGYAKTYGSDASTKFTKACQRPTVQASIGPGRALLVHSAIEVVFFPNDSKLESLARLMDETGRKEMLARLQPHDPELWEGTLTPLSYKPERRFVARLDVRGQPRGIIKLYADREFQRARDTARAVQSARTLQLPDRLGSSSHDQTVLFNWLPGTALEQVISGPVMDRAVVRNVGVALAELHNQSGKGLDKQKPQKVREKIHTATAGIRTTSPHLAELTSRIDDRLGRLIVDDQPELSAIHGDFYADQVLSHGDRVSIIDLDNTVRGNPASDLGLFIAHLERTALSEGRPKTQVDTVREALTEGYGSVREAPSQTRIALHTAVGLVQLAPHHFRNREPNWQQRTEVTLRRALEILDNLPILGSGRPLAPEPHGVAR